MKFESKTSRSAYLEGYPTLAMVPQALSGDFVSIDCQISLPRELNLDDLKFLDQGEDCNGEVGLFHTKTNPAQLVSFPKGSRPVS